jgi:bifunctional non-homologous end joining protein LigD
VHFGSLLLGAHDARRRFVYCGRVGTGFSGTSLSSLAKRLQKLATASSPFAAPLPRSETRDVHWVKPDVVVEVAFREWTRGGHLRQPSFQGVRDDKPARDVRLERARDGAAAAPRASPRPAIRLTHPERVLYPEDGITKRELVDYYAAVAEWMLPHVAGRPLTLVRCPEGLGRPCFYQKHAKASLPRSVRAVDVPKEGGVEHYVAIDDLDGLLALVQSSVLEFHPWGSRADAIDRPDRIVFDLDPHPDVAWDLVVKTAHAMRELLQRLELQSFARTTGGKGLHVVVPIERRASWPRVKQFSKSVVATVAERVPELYVLTATKSKRTGRIFLDYLRNDRGSTAIAPYSTRARAGAPVATPIAWDELTSDLDPRAFDVRSVPQRLRALQRDDPWAELFELRQRLPAAGASSARRRKSALKR